MTLARKAGDRTFDPATNRCLIARDTFWYAIALLADSSPAHRAAGNRLLRTIDPEDATHTPATFLAILHRMGDTLEPATADRLDQKVRGLLVESAGHECRDGNINHPLGAYATLILGGERSGQAWAVELGTRRLAQFRERIADHRGRFRRQAEMSEYNSPTYTALNLWFLSMIAQDALAAEARDLARFLEERLWVNVAMHFHAPSQQFAGPHARAYLDDSMGGFSALHCTMLAAFDDPLFLAPDLAVRFNHPSALIENALVAILPFHVPEQARAIAWRKPFPYSFRMTTYGERYHENSRQLQGVPDATRRSLAVGEAVRDPAERASEAPFAFDDEVYPGGWSDLSTYMTGEYALGSAALPYVNAGHSDGVMLRLRRARQIRSLSDFRSINTRGVFNDSRPGVRNVCHVSRSAVDESYLTEEGRLATYQHENRLIVCYAPKRAGHVGVRSFRLDLIAGYVAPFDELLAGGTPVTEFPARLPAGAEICFRDYRTFCRILTLKPHPAASERPVVLWRSGEFLLLSMVNYDGPPASFTRQEINGWRTGFAMELATADELSWEEFLQRGSGARLSENVRDGMVREVRFDSGGDSMEFAYDPYREAILSRRWNGQEEWVEHFEVRAAGSREGEFCPPTLYGREEGR